MIKDSYFHSSYTDVDAIEKLAGMLTDLNIANPFAIDLVNQYTRKSKFNQTLSEKQMAWVHKLVIDNDVKQRQKRALAIVDEDLPKIELVKIVDIFDKAASNVRFPKMFFMMENGLHLSLKRTYQGVILIESSSMDKPAQINAQGFYFGTLPIEVMNVLEKLNENPVEFAAIYGQLTSLCCFCHRKITQKKSLAVGYGATCAKHYDLPY
jgi:hypothetical protein